MPFKSRKKTAASSSAAKTSKYSSKSLKDYSLELEEYQKNGLIKSFLLPSSKDEHTSKLGNKKVYIDDILFDSIIESRFYILLLKSAKAKKIKSFELQKEFVLQPAFKKNNQTIRKISYFADFVVHGIDGKTDVIDVKGIETDVFKIKKKLFEYVYPNLNLVCYKYIAKDKKWCTSNEYAKLKKQSKKKVNK
jgi:hypothetical protein